MDNLAQAQLREAHALYRRGMLVEAEAAYREVLRRQPDNVDALHMAGLVAVQCGRLDEGVALIGEAVRLDGRIVAAHGNLGAGLQLLGRYAEALASYDRAIALKPDYVEALANRAGVLTDMGDYAAALASSDRAIALKPEHADAHYNRGNALRGLRRHVEAVTSYDWAMRLRPDYAEACANQSLCFLALGQFDRGWQLYEWRKQVRERVGDRQYAQPAWLGRESIAGKTLFIQWEQGFGDTLQFCRYARLARERGARVVMSVQEPLRRLIGTLGADVTIIAENAVPAAFDAHCPMMSLPLAFDTQLETIPTQDRYLTADAAAVAAWRARVAPLPGPRVGLCWAGNPRRHQPSAQVIDQRRSIALARLAPLAAIAGVSFVSLQKGEAAGAAVPAGMSIHDWTDELHDFADTAALIEALDLVVTVDTAVAHLAGALGKPVWILNRFDACWRWLQGRDDSPWYPSARLWHQPAPGDWDSVIAAVGAALRTLAHGDAAGCFECGICLAAQGRHVEAIACYDQAIAIAPDLPAAHANRGTALAALRRHGEALASYDRAITLQPDYAEALANRGNVLAALQRHAEALASYDRAIQLRPEQAEVYANRGVLLGNLLRHAEALASHDRAIALKPDFAEAYCNRGIIFAILQRYDEAQKDYERAIALKPGYAEAHTNLGVALADMHRYEAALASYDRAIALAPGRAEIYTNRGVVLSQLQRPTDALASHDRAIALRPDFAEAFTNRGNVLTELQRYDEAVASYDRAIALKPGGAEAHANRGTALKNSQRHREALASQDAAIALRPGYADANWGQSLCLLALGQFERGWRQFEWRKQLKEPHGNRAPGRPLWLGQENIAGKTLFIHWEQGMGDTLQFCRYARLAQALGAGVIVSAQAPLRRLLTSLHPEIEVLADAAVPSDFDYHCPMMSLPLAFGTRLDTIPATVPYLAAEAGAVAVWRRRIAALPGLRVGLCWAGNPRHDNPAAHAIDRRRSMRPAELAPLGVADVSFVSLQKGEAVGQVAAAPDRMSIRDWTDELTDFADTAALVEALDLVVTVDTAVAHLAGALGKPVWILNRFDACWRWLVGRVDSPWYPTARLFRQPKPGDWDSVVAEAATALRGFGAASPGCRGDETASSANVAQADGKRVAAASGLVRRAAARWEPDRKLAREAREAAAHVEQGNRLAARRRYASALARFDRAIALKPDYAVAYTNRGNALSGLRRLEAALASHDKAIEIDPDYALTYINRGYVLADLGRHEEALASYDRAIAIKPDFFDAHYNRGLVLHHLARFEDALASHGRAIELRPDHAAAYYDCGVILNSLQRHEAALASYDRALALRADHVSAHWNRSLCLLALGDYERGWREYEWRKRTKDAVGNRIYRQPLWLGETSIAGKTLFIHAEQGLGDTIQFCRYATLAEAAGARVVMSVPDQVRRLLRTLGPGITLIGADATPDAFDCHCPMMSLPLAFGTTLATVPRTVPYLLADPAAVAAWRRRIAGLGRPRVGICWAGDPRPDHPAAHAVDRRRSMRLAQFAPLATVAGASFVSLQKGVAAGQVADPPEGMSFHNWTDELTDFADTAALVTALDLVVTVDTAVAHLAGTLGKPVWILNRYDACWRWLVGREDSPWYPTARLWRQPRPGDWARVVEGVAAALRVG
jgi:tetratricopeptide (TPR) repeat protein